MAWPYNSSNRL